MTKQKYIVEKIERTVGNPHWAIWMGDNDVICWDEETANKVCEALNMTEKMKKNERKIRELYQALGEWVGED
jgi:hypothetical protein